MPSLYLIINAIQLDYSSSDDMKLFLLAHNFIHNLFNLSKSIQTSDPSSPGLFVFIQSFLHTSVEYPLRQLLFLPETHVLNIPIIWKLLTDLVHDASWQLYSNPSGPQTTVDLSRKLPVTHLPALIWVQQCIINLIQEQNFNSTEYRFFVVIPVIWLGITVNTAGVILSVHGCKLWKKNWHYKERRRNCWGTGNEEETAEEWGMENRRMRNRGEQGTMELRNGAPVKYPSIWWWYWPFICCEGLRTKWEMIQESTGGIRWRKCDFQRVNWVGQSLLTAKR